MDGEEGSQRKVGRDLPPEIDGKVSCMRDEPMTFLNHVVGPMWRHLSSVERWASQDRWQTDERKKLHKKMSMFCSF